VLKVQETDLRFNRSGTLAAEKFEWLEVKGQAGQGDDNLGYELENEGSDEENLGYEQEERRAAERSQKGKSGRFVFESEELEKEESRPSAVSGNQNANEQTHPGGKQKGGGGVLGQLKGVLRKTAQAMEVREPGDSVEANEEGKGSAQSEGLESGAEPVSARAEVALLGPFDDGAGQEAIETPVARNTRLGTLKVRTSAKLAENGEKGSLGRSSEAKKAQIGAMMTLEKAVAEEKDGDQVIGHTAAGVVCRLVAVE
jgi:hypothetical protein